MTDTQAPFSSRHRGSNQHVEDSFPDSAKIAVLHMLYDLEGKGYISDWLAIARELQRISRIQPVIYSQSPFPDVKKARADAEQVLYSLAWDKTFYFCERIYTYLAQDVLHGYEKSELVKEKREVQKYIANEIERLFLEENLAFEFSDGVVRRRGRRHTEDTATRAQVVMGDSRLNESRKHYAKALHFFRSPTSPDYENCVKEAVCAVEAAGKALFPASKAATLGDLAKWFLKTNDYEIPKALVKTIEGIYAYRSGGNGVGHGGAEGGIATLEVAEYILSVTASQIIYFVEIEGLNDEIPF
ncbi:hypothetical protein [Aeromonas hydrophila]|uniref:hypothetical protein n=1 Tax=Aeromonas hydrophila TaxID=644 RepID=UPI0030174F8E